MTSFYLTVELNRPSGDDSRIREAIKHLFQHPSIKKGPYIDIQKKFAKQQTEKKNDDKIIEKVEVMETETIPLDLDKVPIEELLNETISGEISLSDTITSECDAWIEREVQETSKGNEEAEIPCDWLMFGVPADDFDDKSHLIPLSEKSLQQIADYLHQKFPFAYAYISDGRTKVEGEAITPQYLYNQGGVFLSPELWERVNTSKTLPSGLKYFPLISIANNSSIPTIGDRKDCIIQ